MTIATSDLLSGIDAQAVQALIDGRHDNPFSILGPHRTDEETVVGRFFRVRSAWKCSTETAMPR